MEEHADGLVQALVAPGSLLQLASSAAVSSVTPPARPVAQAVDEAVTSTGAGEWQAAGYGGAGVKIAIIDLGFYGYQSLLGSALPASVTTDDRCNGNLAASPAAGGTEHGTAVAELVHQMAPGAQLYLICVDTEVDLALAEQDAIADGVRIVNHSVAWLNTSRGDGTGGPGTPDAIVADARAHGILWVNAAGNFAEDHWSGSFAPDGVDPSFNDFAPGVETDGVTMQSGEQACVTLKWDDWPVTSEDFDLGLYAGNGTLVASSSNDQAGGPLPPTEELCYTNTGPTQNFGIAIHRYSAAGSPRFDLYYTGESTLEYATAAGSLTEPASSPDALAVGANCVQTPKTLEAYSSEGPTIDGRVKPDLVAPDNVSTVTYGAATLDGDECGISGFDGTSAAAPQVAGAAAIVLQSNPSLSPSDVTRVLGAATSWPVYPLNQEQWGDGMLNLPSRAGNSGQLVVSDGGIATINRDGTARRLIATSSLNSAPIWPSWSPDGRKVVFEDQLNNNGANSQLVEVNADGTGMTQITNVAPSREPSFSPDGSKIVYSCGYNICVMNADGSSSVQLTTTGTLAAEDMYPAWSPDATKIVWRNVDNTIWEMNANGTSPGSLIDTGLISSAPSWSPDGTRIVFSNGGSVDVVNANGTGITRIGGGGGRATWSPDSSLIAVSNGGVIYTQTPTGTNFTQIPVPAPSDSDPNWQSAAALVAAPVVTTAPAITGTPRVGQTLTAGFGSWTGDEPMQFGFQWDRCNAGGGGCTPIGGAAESTYLVTSLDSGATLRATVTATNPNGSVDASSSTTLPVAPLAPYAAALPTIVGAVTSGSTLSATAGTWQNAAAPFTYRWRRCATDGSTCADIGATGSSYTLVGADVGSTIRLAVREPSGAGDIFASSVQSAIVTGSSGGGSGGSGGGGGGGGGAIPDLAITVGGPVQVAVGGQATFSLAVSDANGATASGVHAIVTLPAGALVDSTSSDRGPGCAEGAVAATLDCNLDFLSGPLVAHVTITLTLASAGQATLSASVSDAQGDKNTANNSGSATVQVGTPTPASTPAPTASPPPAAAVHCVVPRLTGDTLVKAKTAISRAHCSVGHVNRKESERVARGRISAESPKVGSKLRKGGKIDLTISTGRPKKA